MNLGSFKSALVSMPSAIVASLCCLLPLLVIILGLGSGAFMMYTMRYSSIFIPVGIVGVTIGYVLFFREKGKCDAMGCRMAGKNVNLALLIIATVMVTIAVLLQIFPEFTASLITGVR
jgi:TRAP-type uncharacterized transport system fused permease subunit